jgi:hypothetical protein
LRISPYRDITANGIAIILIVLITAFWFVDTNIRIYFDISNVIYQVDNDFVYNVASTLKFSSINKKGV